MDKATKERIKEILGVMRLIVPSNVADVSIKLNDDSELILFINYQTRLFFTWYLEREEMTLAELISSVADRTKALQPC